MGVRQSPVDRGAGVRRGRLLGGEGERDVPSAHRRHQLVARPHASPSPGPQARDRKIAQDPAAAGSYGKTAKHLNITACCLGIAATIIFIVAVVTHYNNLQTGRRS